MPVPDTLTKAEVLANMRAGWADLWAFLGAFSEAQLTQPTDAGGWSVKDHVVHLVAWEGSLNDFFEKKPRWEYQYMRVSLPMWQNGGIDAINDEIYLHNKDLSWARVKQIFQQAHEELIGRVEALSEEDLQRPYNYYQPGAQQTDTAAHRIGIATYDHYLKHIPWIQAIVASYPFTMTEQNVTSKAELLAAIQQNWNAFNAYLDTLTEAQLTQPTDPAGWTAKDHVAHLWVWEDGMNAFLQKQPRPEHMGIDAETWSGGDFDRINAIIQQRYKNLSWAEVRQRFQDSHQRLLDQLQALSDDDLQRPYNYYQPASAATDPAINRLAGNTFHHYAEHQPWIDAIVKSTL